jgi:hypothetical protein
MTKLFEGNGRNCSECGNFETVKLFKMLGVDAVNNLWCASCVRAIGLIPDAKPCGHLVSAKCGCVEA